MKLVSVKAIENQETISIPVMTLDGRVLLPAGARITERLVERLCAHGIFSVYIHDDFYKDVEGVAVLDDNTKLLAMNTISKAYKLADADKLLDEYEIKNAVKEIIRAVRASMGMPIILFNNIAVTDQRWIHAINVCVISVVLALFKGYMPDVLEDIAVGAFLHDIKLKGFRSDYNSEHVDTSLEYLRKHHGFGARITMTVYGHHERNDGSGFPRKVKDKDIYEGAKIVAVADEYDNLAAGYMGQDSVQSYIAHEMINMKSTVQLDKEIVQIFNENIATYPTGVGVTLNNGESGVVVAQNSKLPTRPVVRVKTADNQKREYNLASELTLFIESVDI